MKYYSRNQSRVLVGGVESSGKARGVERINLGEGEETKGAGRRRKESVEKGKKAGERIKRWEKK